MTHTRAVTILAEATPERLRVFAASLAQRVWLPESRRLRWGEGAPPPSLGARPGSTTGRSEMQGSAQRGAGTRLRDATVKPIVRRVARPPILCASPASHLQSGPCSSLRRAPWGCDRGGACESRKSARSHPATGSHPSKKRLEPAPPCAGRFVGRLADILDIGCVVLRASVNSNPRRARASSC